MASMAMEVGTPRVVSQAEWLTARKEHWLKEKELTRLRDELSRQRRTLPWHRVEKQYLFDGARGPESFSELFDGRSQLIVYHFMLGPGWPEGCKSCSMFSDALDGITTHLANRDTTLVVISRAPLSEIQAFQKRMGWKFHWVSSFHNDFNYDFHVSFTPEQLAAGTVPYNYSEVAFPVAEAPGASVFAKNAGGEIFHTYSAFARGLDGLMPIYSFLDLVPKGRAEDALDFSMSWVRHHDRYEQVYFGQSAQAMPEVAVSHSCCSGSRS